MSLVTPLVLERASLDDAVQHVLEKHDGTSTLIFCGTKNDFVGQLTSSQPANRAATDHETAAPLSTIGSEKSQPWWACLLYTSPSPRDGLLSRMPSSA